MFCNAFYQPKEFYAVSHGRVNILTPLFEEMDCKIGLFIATLINKERYRFSYGRAVYSSVISKLKINLPIEYDENNNPKLDEKAQYSDHKYIPDFKLMKEYIESLDYGTSLNIENEQK